MKNPMTSTLTLIACIALSACLTLQADAKKKDDDKKPIDRMMFDSGKQQLWPIVVSEIGLNYPIESIDKDSGLITTDFVDIDAGYGNRHMKNWVVDPGGFLATWNGLRMKLNIMLIELSDDQTQVVVRTHFEAFENNSKKRWVVAKSNGTIESEIFQSITDRL